MTTEPKTFFQHWLKSNLVKHKKKSTTQKEA